MNRRLFCISIESDCRVAKMSKPNFQAMNIHELRRYILVHKDDTEV
jgi:hypothetical protein